VGILDFKLSVKNLEANMYKLKLNQPDFECVDGPFAGRKYKTGQTYAEIPPNEAHRFEGLSGLNGLNKGGKITHDT